MKYTTSAAYLSGGICGAIWWPVGALCGKPIKKNLRGPWGIMPEKDNYSFEDMARQFILREGGDFQNPLFTNDTIIRIERKTATPQGYQVRVKEILLSTVAPSWVDPEHETCEFSGED
jgi:hypothetical protein